MRSTGLKPHYAIKNPSKTQGKGKRASFAIQEVTGSNRVTLKLEPVDAVNKLLASGVLTVDQARKQIEAVREALYLQRDKHKPQTVFASENLKLVAAYWAAEYEDRELVDPDSARWDLNRAVAACGILSVVGASKSDLQQAVLDHAPGDVNKRRRVIARLNQLLKFAGRAFELKKPKPVRGDIKHLTEAEFERVVAQIKQPDMKLLCRVAFCTGARVGEALGLTERSVRPDHVQITTQLDSDFKRRETKTRSVRKAAVLEGWEHYVTEWVALGPEVKLRLRKLQHATLVKRACRRAFPNLEDKYCHFHDLRHSYAVHLVSRGVPLTLVAQSLGNSISVCEKYYSGFVLTDESVERIRTIMRGGAD